MENQQNSSKVNQPVLEVKNLITSIRVGNQICRVVDDLSFELYPGKTLALVGESGCGKSMTALSILRILPHPLALPSDGKILYQGIDLLTLPEKKMCLIRGAKIAMIFQDPMSALNPVYTIGDQLKEVVEIHLGIYGDEAEERALRALSEVHIASPRERLHEYPYQMSGGMKQRIMIAMALMCEPDILIADEPTTALDVTIQAQVLDLMRELQRRRKMALLLITHDMSVVAEMAHHVIVMYASKCVEQGDVYQIFDSMAHPYTMGLFKSRLSGEVPRGHLQPIQGFVPSLGHYPRGCRFHPRCPYVMNKCKNGEVPNFNVAGLESHKALCWLYESTQKLS